MKNKQEKNQQRLNRLRLLDDDFMNKAFEDSDCTELLLQVILNKADLNVQRVQTQVALQNLQGRSARLDILATDTQGNRYNVEVQRKDDGALPKRARYYSSMLDANITNPGEEFNDLPESYVIFITEKDVLQNGKPIYHIDRIVAETGRRFNDAAHIIYVNAQIQDETALGRLMHDFHCTNADDMHYSVLAERVRYFKENEKGVTTMSEIWDEVREEGKEEKATEMAKSMLQDNYLNYDKIAEYSGLPLDTVLTLAKEVHWNNQTVRC